MQHVLATISLREHRKAYVTCNFNFRTELKGFSRSQAATYSVKVIVSRKWFKLATFYGFTTDL